MPAEPLPLPHGDSPEAMEAALAMRPGELREQGVTPVGIVTDPHAYPHAFAATLDALHALGIPPERVICLGDLVDYGPDPAATVRLARGLGLTVCGNHDCMAVSIGATIGETALSDDSWTFMADCIAERPYHRTTSHELFGPHGLPLQMLFIHDAPRALRSGPGSAGNRVRDLSAAAREFGVMREEALDVCFFGHTHMRAIWQMVPDEDSKRSLPIPTDHGFDQPSMLDSGEIRMASPPADAPLTRVVESLDVAVWFHPSERYLINVGSVAEQRDLTDSPQAGVLTPWWYAHLRLPPGSV